LSLDTVSVVVVANTTAIAEALVAQVREPHHATALSIGQITLATSSLVEMGGAWILALEPDQSDDLLQQLDDERLPVMIVDPEVPLRGTDEYDRWNKRVGTRIDQFVGRIAHQHLESLPPSQVVILAASLGGPDAVREFLEDAPTKGVAYIYVQHIGDDFNRVLMQMVELVGKHRCAVATTGMKISSDFVYIVDSKLETTVTDGGYFNVSRQGWRGDYSPSINHVVLSAARIFGRRCTAVFFSGMGDDGVQGARYLASLGRPVWVQSEESCQAASMPEAVASVANSILRGTPSELAAFVTQYVYHAQQEASL